MGIGLKRANCVQAGIARNILLGSDVPNSQVGGSLSKSMKLRFRKLHEFDARRYGDDKLMSVETGSQTYGNLDQKSPLMYLAILGLWAGCLFRFELSLLLLFDATNNLFSWLVLTVFVALLNLFWLFGCNF